MIQLIKNWLTRYLSDPQLVILGFLLLFGFLFIFWLGDMLTPALIALIIAYILDGLVELLIRIRLPRLIAVLLVFVFFMACVVIIILGLLPILSRQIGQLIHELPDMISGVQKGLIQLPQKYPDFISEAQIKSLIQFLSSELTKLAQGLLSWSMASVKGFIAILIYLILVPLLVFFFLKDKTLILNWCMGFLPEHRSLATEVWRDVNRQIVNYIRGKMWEILIIWGISYVTFIVLNLQFALLLALFVGLSVLIPYIGATVMYLPIGLIAYFQWGIGSEFVTVIIVYSIIQGLDGNLLVPILLSGVVNLHPVAIIVAVLVFGGLWGLWGLFFAIPLATLFHAVIKAWFGHYKYMAEKKPSQMNPPTSQKHLKKPTPKSQHLISG